MNNEIYNLLHSMPANAPGDTSDLTDLDTEDIPWDRVPKLQALLSGTDDFVALQAAMLLAHWGNAIGFDYLCAFVCARPPLAENWMPHRLRNYDDTYKNVLDALMGYWAKQADAGHGEEARMKLFKPVSQIIDLSNRMQFGLEYFFWLVEKKGFTEYLPALKNHLTEILKSPEFHHWKIADCAHLLMKLDEPFVIETLASHGKTIADFPNK